MQVLFVKDVPGMANAGQTKNVADGYARNYLLPRKLAVLATPSAIKQAEAIKQAVVRREAHSHQQAQELAALLDNIHLTFKMKAGSNSRLFGAITAADIAAALKREHQISIDKRKIVLDHPIKDLGERMVPIKVHPEVTAHVHVMVEKEAV